MAQNRKNPIIEQSKTNEYKNKTTVQKPFIVKSAPTKGTAEDLRRARTIVTQARNIVSDDTEIEKAINQYEKIADNLCNYYETLVQPDAQLLDEMHLRAPIGQSHADLLALTLQAAAVSLPDEIDYNKVLEETARTFKQIAEIERKMQKEARDNCLMPLKHATIVELEKFRKFAKSHMADTKCNRAKSNLAEWEERQRANRNCSPKQKEGQNKPGTKEKTNGANNTLLQGPHMRAMLAIIDNSVRWWSVIYMRYNKECADVFRTGLKNVNAIISAREGNNDHE